MAVLTTIQRGTTVLSAYGPDLGPLADPKRMYSLPAKQVRPAQRPGLGGSDDNCEETADPGCILLALLICGGRGRDGATMVFGMDPDELTVTGLDGEDRKGSETVGMTWCTGPWSRRRTSQSKTIRWTGRRS